VLQASGLEYATQGYGSLGQAVCQVDEEPAAYSTCLPSGGSYWALFTSRAGGAWQAGDVGISSLDFANGDAEGLRYDPETGPDPAPPSPAGVCAAAGSSVPASGGAPSASPGAAGAGASPALIAAAAVFGVLLGLAGLQLLLRRTARREHALPGGVVGVGAGHRALDEQSRVSSCRPPLRAQSPPGPGAPGIRCPHPPHRHRDRRPDRHPADAAAEPHRASTFWCGSPPVSRRSAGRSPWRRSPSAWPPGWASRRRCSRWPHSRWSASRTSWSTRCPRRSPAPVPRWAQLSTSSPAPCAAPPRSGRPSACGAGERGVSSTGRRWRCRWSSPPSRGR
jgi:hypothetical protein